MVVLVWGLDWMTLKVSSNLDNSMMYPESKRKVIFSNASLVFCFVYKQTGFRSE